jgi:hypothetical protein
MIPIPKHSLQLVLAGLLLGTTAFAQYPKIPSAAKKTSDSLLAEAERKSEIAWQKALPVIEAEAKKGKPYIPWAARPVDLPQSDIPAFPGAEGGGAFSFGGRGGQVT